MKKSKNPFKVSSYLGLGIILVSAILMLVGNNVGQDVLLPSGFSSVILAIEFANTSTALTSIVQQLSETDKSKLILSTWIDMGFLIIYGAFLFSMLRTVQKIIDLDVYKTLAYLGVLAALADVVENVQIIKVLGGHSIEIMVLQIATWVKWLSLAAAFLFKSLVSFFVCATFGTTFTFSLCETLSLSDLDFSPQFPVLNFIHFMILETHNVVLCLFAFLSFSSIFHF